jgi:hypothetical protein
VLSDASVASGLDVDVDDEALAREARARYRIEGIASIEPDHEVRAAMLADERLLAVRPSASVGRILDGIRSSLSGRLAVTTKRLMVVGPAGSTLSSLDELDDVTLATDRLLVILTTGAGFTIQTNHPRLLRVQLAEARADWHAGQRDASSNAMSEMPSDRPRL